MVKRPLGRLIIKWDNDIKIDFEEVGCEDMGRI
jgi:hypothetical protein